MYLSLKSRIYAKNGSVEILFGGLIPGSCSVTPGGRGGGLQFAKGVHLVQDSTHPYHIFTPDQYLNTGSEKSQ